MSVDDEVFLAIADVALGLQNEMQANGRPMMAEEIATVMLAYSLQQTAIWIEQSLDWDKERRLELALILTSQYRKLTGQ